MPPELKEVDWASLKPKGMTDLTLSGEYIDICTAFESGLTPGQFRLLPFMEQAELTAYWYVNNRIRNFQADEQQKQAVQRQKEMDAKANKQGNNRR